METPLRILRAQADSIAKPFRLPTMEQNEKRNRIKTVGLGLIARFGRANLTVGRLAQAMVMQTATFRRHFVDLDMLLAELIADELRRLSRLIAEVPKDAPDRPAAQRAALFAATRPLGGLCPGWQLVVRDLPDMPPDLRGLLQPTLDRLMAELAGDLAPQYLALLGLPLFSHAELEAMLAAVAAITPVPLPEPETTAPETTRTETTTPEITAPRTTAPATTTTPRIASVTNHAQAPRPAPAPAGLAARGTTADAVRPTAAATAPDAPRPRQLHAPP